MYPLWGCLYASLIWNIHTKLLLGTKHFFKIETVTHQGYSMEVNIVLSNELCAQFESYLSRLANIGSKAGHVDWNSILYKYCR